MLSRPCRKRRPSSRDEGGISWVFLSCSASVGFLTRYDGELREPLMWCRGRGSQAPRRAVCGTRGSLRTMHGGGSAPSCCAFTHRVAFEEGSGPPVSTTMLSTQQAGIAALVRGQDAMQLWRNPSLSALVLALPGPGKQGLGPSGSKTPPKPHRSRTSS